MMNLHKGMFAALFSLLMLCLAAMPTPALAQNGAEANIQGMTCVASETAAQHAKLSYFQAYDNHTFVDSDIPYALVPKDAPERTFVYGATVGIAFAHLNPKAKYAIEMTFLSGVAAPNYFVKTTYRLLLVRANNVVLGPPLPLTANRILTQRWAIPSRAIEGGRLTISLDGLTPPNAVVSGFKLYSTDPRTPVVGAMPAPVMPTYTPRPAALAGVAQRQVSLNGTWRFNPAAPDGFLSDPGMAGGAWKPIQVPGEWYLQGFNVGKFATAAYTRSFTVPASWHGQRVKLRCDNIYGHAEVWINGKKAGSHDGVYTPFQLDVTDLVRPGSANKISVAARSYSIADAVDSGMDYGQRDLGGITRKIYLFAVPAENVADLYITTQFDPQYQNATLRVAAQVTNDGRALSAPARLRFQLKDGAGRAVALAPSSVPIPPLKPGQAATVNWNAPVTRPRQWDVEHPNLYTLTCAPMAANGQAGEVVSKEFGFRQVDIRGNQVFLNNHPLKLRGICRHEEDPRRGRSLAPGEWEQDIRLLRDANVNVIRTTHYPPAEEMIDACDRLGMFVEDEAPDCWVNFYADPLTVAEMKQSEAEMVMRDRSHPSVLIWDLGNENGWNIGFPQNMALTRALDPTRPIDFEGGGVPPNTVDIATLHYPPFPLPASFDTSPIPMDVGEFVHMTNYNRRELYTDPGLRDVWGEAFSQQWESIMQSRGTVGGNIFAAGDEIVFSPDGKTYGWGPWGIIDGWRRPKPEYFYVKKVYSPVRVVPEATPLSAQNGAFRFHVENRQDFSNLNELRFRWKLGAASGTAKASAPPHSNGTLTIPVPTGAGNGQTLTLRVVSPRGFDVDDYEFPLGPPQTVKAVQTRSPSALTLTQTPDTITVGGRDYSWRIDARTGAIQSGMAGGRLLVTSGPHLMLMPWHDDGLALWSGDIPNYQPVNDACTGWKATSVTATQSANAVVVTVAGAYDQAKGVYTMTFDQTGRLTASYTFAPTAPINVWEMGLAFDVPRSLDTLSWTRQTAWSGYPADHIGRPSGTARAFSGTPNVGAPGPRTRPAWAWSQDDSSMGSNDFRSEKWHVQTASLTDGGGAGLRLLSDGRQNVRCWIEGGHIRLFVMDFANQGSAGFVNERIYPNRALVPGTSFTGAAALDLAAPQR